MSRHRRSLAPSRRQGYSARHHEGGEIARRIERRAEQFAEQCVTAQADLSGWSESELRAAWGDR
jgi:hypothetical protein